MCGGNGTRVSRVTDLPIPLPVRPPPLPRFPPPVRPSAVLPIYPYLLPIYPFPAYVPISSAHACAGGSGNGDSRGGDDRDRGERSRPRVISSPRHCLSTYGSVGLWKLDGRSLRKTDGWR